MADIELSTADSATLAAIRGALGAPNAALTLRFPDDEVSPPSPVLPAKATRQDKLLGFATTGAPKEIDPVAALTPPLIADFAGGWFNQGIATATDLSNIYAPKGLVIKTAAGTVGVCGLVKALAGTSTWTYRARVSFGQSGTNYCHHGFVLREAATGKLRLYGLRFDASLKFQRLHYTNPTTFSALDNGIACPIPFAAYQRTWDLRLVNNGTNISCECSPDGGINWFTFINEAKATFMVPDQIGIYTDRGATYGSSIHCTHWEVGL